MTAVVKFSEYRFQSCDKVQRLQETGVRWRTCAIAVFGKFAHLLPSARNS